MEGDTGVSVLNQWQNNTFKIYQADDGASWKPVPYNIGESVFRY